MVDYFNKNIPEKRKDKDYYELGTKYLNDNNKKDSY